MTKSMTRAVVVMIRTTGITVGSLSIMQYKQQGYYQHFSKWSHHYNSTQKQVTLCKIMMMMMMIISFIMSCILLVVVVVLIVVVVVVVACRAQA